MKIFKIMKLRAMFCTLLILLIGFAGFGFTTSDLGQNSTAAVSPLEVENAVIVVNTDFYEFQISEAINFSVNSEIDMQFESESFSSNVIEFHSFGIVEIVNSSPEGTNNPMLKSIRKPVDKQEGLETHKNDLGGVLSLFYNYSLENSNTYNLLAYYRKPRDGIRV